MIIFFVKYQTYKMPVKHFVTFETKASFPKGRDQLKLLWNDVYWTEGERFKMDGGGWNYIDGYGNH